MDEQLRPEFRRGCCQAHRKLLQCRSVARISEKSRPCSRLSEHDEQRFLPCWLSQLVVGEAMWAVWPNQVKAPLGWVYLDITKPCKPMSLSNVSKSPNNIIHYLELICKFISFYFVMFAEE
ncbi:hypothetical protein V2J09_003895, partial [Rumex salicifolius]